MPDLAAERVHQDREARQLQDMLHRTQVSHCTTIKHRIKHGGTITSNRNPVFLQRHLTKPGVARTPRWSDAAQAALNHAQRRSERLEGDCNASCDAQTILCGEMEVMRRSLGQADVVWFAA